MRVYSAAAAAFVVALDVDVVAVDHVYAVVVDAVAEYAHAADAAASALGVAADAIAPVDVAAVVEYDTVADAEAAADVALGDTVAAAAAPADVVLVFAVTAATPPAAVAVEADIVQTAS
jgi:hypothetical protein